MGWTFLDNVIDITGYLTEDAVNWQTTATITELPVGTTAIWLRTRQTDTTARGVGARHPDVTSELYGLGHINRPNFFFVGVKDRTIDYLCTSKTNSYWEILAYTDNAGEGYGTAGTYPAKTPSATGSYDYKTMSELAAGAVFAAILIDQGSDPYPSGFRAYGTANDEYYYKVQSGVTTAFCPLAAGNAGEIKVAHLTKCPCYLTGGLITGAVAFDTPQAITVSATGWLTIDASAVFPAGANIAILEVRNTNTSSARTCALRNTGSSEDITTGVAIGATNPGPTSQFRLVGLNADREFDINVSNKDEVLVKAYGYISNTSYNLSKIGSSSIGDIASVTGVALTDIAKIKGVSLETPNKFSFTYVSNSYDKSDEDSVDVVISRTVGTGEANVTLTVTGGKEAGEDYGIGPNYTGDKDYTWTNNGYEDNSCVVTFADTVTTATVTLDIINNPNAELDREMTLTLSNPSIGVVTGGTRTITVIDDSGYTLYDATVDYATWGGSDPLQAGSEDYAVANSDTLDALYAWCIANLDPITNQVVVYLPDGTYYLDVQNKLHPGVVFWGESKNGVIFKRPSKAWYIAQGYPVADDGHYSYYLFINPFTSAYWVGLTDAKYCGFVNLTFDGNYDDFIPFPSYTYEPSHFIKFWGASSGVNEGRVSALLENIVFQNNLTSNYTTGSAIIASYYNIDHIGGNPSKGDFSYVSGNVASVHCLETTYRGIDFEILEGQFGYYDDYRQSIRYDKCNINLLQYGSSWLNEATFTSANVDTVNDILSFSWPGGLPVKFSTTGTLPGGLVEDTIYYLEYVTKTTYKFRVSPGGAYVDFTDGGSGDHTMTLNVGTVELTLNDCNVENFYCFSGAGDVQFNRCVVNPTDYGGNGDRMYFSAARTFVATDCVFNLIEGSSTERNGMWWHHVNPTASWVFDTCEFNKNGEWVYPASVFYGEDISPGVAGTFSLIDCTFSGFSGDDDYVIYNGNGGKVSIVRPTLVNCKNFLSMYGTSVVPFQLSVEGPVTITGGLNHYLWTRQTNIPYPQNTITHVMDDVTPTVILTDATCMVASGAADTGGAGIRTFTYSGQRRITGTEVSANITGLPGDEFYDTDTSAVTHTVTVEGDGNEGGMGYYKIQTDEILPTTWTAIP